MAWNPEKVNRPCHSTRKCRYTVHTSNFGPIQIAHAAFSESESGPVVWISLNVSPKSDSVHLALKNPVYENIQTLLCAIDGCSNVSCIDTTMMAWCQRPGLLFLLLFARALHDRLQFITPLTVNGVDSGYCYSHLRLNVQGTLVRIWSAIMGICPAWTVAATLTDMTVRRLSFSASHLIQIPRSFVSAGIERVTEPGNTAALHMKLLRSGPQLQCSRR